MILLCSPRSGSVWFFSGLTSNPYTHVEIFGFRAQRLRTDRKESKFSNISTKARLSLVKNDKNKFWKIFFSDLDFAPTEKDRQLLITELQKMELYCLSRSDFKKSIVSLAIALGNDWNFHDSNEQLTRPFKLTEDQVNTHYHIVYGNYLKYKHMFNFKEEFVYEDLVSGKQVPKSFNWDPKTSTIVERNSMNYVHLIENWHQVEKWIDQLPK